MPVNVLVTHRLWHQLHRGLLHGLHPSSAEGWSLLILNLVLTSLSRRFIGLLYATNGRLLNILAMHFFDCRDAQFLCAISAMYVVCGL